MGHLILRSTLRHVSYPFKVRVRESLLKQPSDELTTHRLVLTYL